MGMLLKQTKIEAEEGNCEARQTLEKIGSAYLKHREVSAQEAVYRVCNLKMKECSRKVVFVPVGENPTRLSKPLSQIKQKTHKKKEETNQEENEEEEDIWMTNIVERYEHRPNKTMFHDMCLAEFCSEYRVLAKSQVPKTPNENVFELQNSKGFIQKRTRTKPAVIRYPRFRVDKMSEKYYQCLLQLFLPHERATQLKPPAFDLYQTFYENGHVKTKNDQNLQAVKLLVDRNHAKFAENEEMISNAQETFKTIGEPQDAWASLCPETELMRKECMEERSTLNVLDDHVDEIPDMETEANSADVMFKVQQNNQSREEAMHIIQNLNETQRNIFYYVRDWCLEKSSGQNPDPFHVFITGGAGTGKSHVIKAIHYEASRLLAKNMSTPDSLAVLLTAFTGTAAFNIGGNTIHHLFSMPKFMRLPYEPLKEQTLSELRIHLQDLNVLVIDEVSMVYKRLLYYIHERLVQIKKSKEPFGGVSVIAVGDFYQLPPVKQRKDERLYKDNISYPVDHWQELFKVVELSEIMRQKQDIPFAEVLNSLRTRELQEPLTNETLSMLHECVREGPDDVLHVYATNDEVNNYNLKMLRNSCDNFVEINAQDFEKDTATGKLTLRKKPISRSKTEGLTSSLLVAVNARVMLTRNCNVEDGLVNGVMGKILHFLLKDGNVDHILAVGVLFDNMNVGQRTGRKTPEGNVVLIERVQEEVIEKKSRSFIRHQFPLRLSWACTAHKVQGMTVDKVVVNLDRTFSAGQGYVALTRVKCKDGLFIETNDVSTLH
ncbi:ATP-dependent DNA helicase PIF1-like [Magallana gigas]|uniref:ATP-dependent DNA helicase PIF1-like n=1 Tax=Magallana gigas TaxID=29159 RepID=UPI00333EBA79